jgi:hypothetical protein
MNTTMSSKSYSPIKALNNNRDPNNTNYGVIKRAAQSDSNNGYEMSMMQIQ